MSKSFQFGWINKSLISALAFTTMFVGVYSSILYFNTDLSYNSKFAQAAVACPNGGTDNGAGACIAANKSAAYYACPGGYFLLNGNYCVATTKAGNYLHVSQCSDGYSMIARVSVDNNPAAYAICDAGRSNTETSVFDIVNNRYLSYQFCEAFSGYDMVTRFAVGNGDPGNPCIGDSSRLPNPYTGEQYKLIDLWTGRYSHTDLCQNPSSGANIITRIVQDNDPNPRNGCDSGRIQLESGQVVETGRANTPATYVVAACPSGWADAGGPNCSYTANAALTPADLAALTVSCTSAQPNSVSTCTFDNPNKTLPSDFKLSIGTGGIDAGGSTPAQSCTETANVVTCTNVPTGNSVGALPIYGQFTGTSGSKTPTGETVIITGINFAKADWIFAPDQGGTSPLFRSTDATSVTIKNLKTVFDLAPNSNTRYICNLEYRSLNDRLATTPAWIPVSTTPVAYNTTSGCIFNINKTQRGNSLNYGLKLTITDASITTPTSTNPNTFILNNEYIYRFQGAGVAVGG